MPDFGAELSRCTEKLERTLWQLNEATDECSRLALRLEGAHEEVARLTAALDRAEAEAGRLRELLARPEVQWAVGFDIRDRANMFCPICGNRSTIGHAAFCELAAALAPPPGDRGREGL